MRIASVGTRALDAGSRTRFRERCPFFFTEKPVAVHGGT